jgi:hypothetical protein
MPDEYSLLPEKVLQAYAWALSTFPSIKWLAKVDDDSFVRVKHLEDYLNKYNPEVPMLIGKIIPHHKVPRKGKWAEHSMFKEKHYPPWAKGSAGHVLSRASVEYLVRNSKQLHRYQGEDVSIGIWLDQASKANQLEVTYIQAESSFVVYMKLDKVCPDPSYLMIGHNISAKEMLRCQNSILRKGHTHNAWVHAPIKFP